MNVERTGTGVEARFNIAGFGRFLSAAFLALWLAGWAAGEWFALSALVRGAQSFLTGAPLTGHKPPEPAAALAGGIFLVVWLTFWTYGGILAGCEFLRLLFGRELIRTQFDGIEIVRSYGLFRSTKRLSREEIRRFYQRPGCALCAETTNGPIVLTSLGTPAERTELERMLNAEFHLNPQPVSQGALPKGWCEVLSVEGDAVLVKDPEKRRKQAKAAWIACAALSMIPVYVLTVDRERPDFWRALLAFGAFEAAACCGAVWLSFGRYEWRLEKGRLVLQRRFGQNRTSRFEATALELVEGSSDDSKNYVLTAVAPDAPARTGPHNLGQQRRTIYIESVDPAEPRNLGLWLSRRCQIPFADLTTAEAKAKELEAFKQQLAGSGLGRGVLRIIERVTPPSRRRDV